MLRALLGVGAVGRVGFGVVRRVLSPGTVPVAGMLVSTGSTVPALPAPVTSPSRLTVLVSWAKARFAQNVTQEINKMLPSCHSAFGGWLLRTDIRDS